MSNIITPTVGRKVWFHPNGAKFLQPGGTFKEPISCGQQPMDATVVYVWGDRMVNLDVVDHVGNHFAATSVTLVQDGDLVPANSYAEWMPFQRGQVAQAPVAKEIQQ